MKTYKIYYTTKKTAETIEVEAKNPDQALEMLFSLIPNIVDYEFEDRAILTFNGGKLALLCQDCKTTVKEGKDFSPAETDYALGKSKYLPPIKCPNCKYLEIPPF